MLKRHIISIYVKMLDEKNMRSNIKVSVTSLARSAL